MTGDFLGGLRRAAGRLKQRIAPRVARRLAPGVHSIRLPLRIEHGESWRPHYFFHGRTGTPITLSGHASALAPGHCPHEPHSHVEEEILVILHGEAELLLPGAGEAGEPHTRRLHAGRFAYYPSGFPHSLRAAGNSPTNYLMFKWTSRSRQTATPTGFCEHGLTEAGEGRDVGHGLRSRLIFEGPTLHVKKLHCHVSEIEPGAGYEPHVDGHDVVIVMLDGEIETLESRATPCDVVLCPAGKPHGIRNAGRTPARYAVFEFHGPDEPPWKRALDPLRLRRAGGRMLQGIASRALGSGRA